MLEIMDPAQGLAQAVIVALIGSGQEINTGEAGLGRYWGRTLLRRFSHWKIFISPKLATSSTLYGDGLFEESAENLQVIESPFLHLDISIRS